ncbi:winged helix-turn-helix domain-containing protein [Aliiroseovarius sp. PTFE2010]|uniref:winged helix-turn-helix domain-containing protein n=1 Tax=Aliiroseovarius sp. PTFE2010 TaxID=3417190 RepID=UPI003CF455FC
MRFPKAATDPTSVRRAGSRIVTYGVLAVVFILALAAILLFVNLPTGTAFSERVDRIFVEYDLTSSSQEPETVGRLLGILADSGAAFSDVLASYRVIIFVLLVFSCALLMAALIFLVTIVSLNRRMGEVERAGIQISSLLISREENTVYLNNIELKLTEAAVETLAVLAEARMDEDILSGLQIDAMISGRDPSDCDEATGTMRIKRLRDALGNQIVSELLVKNIARKGYMLSVPRDAIRMI